MPPVPTAESCEDSLRALPHGLALWGFQHPSKALHRPLEGAGYVAHVESRNTVEEVSQKSTNYFLALGYSIIPS